MAQPLGLSPEIWLEAATSINHNTEHKERSIITGRRQIHHWRSAAEAFSPLPVQTRSIGSVTIDDLTRIFHINNLGHQYQQK